MGGGGVLTHRDRTLIHREPSGGQEEESLYSLLQQISSEQSDLEVIATEYRGMHDEVTMSEDMGSDGSRFDSELGAGSGLMSSLDSSLGSGCGSVSGGGLSPGLASGLGLGSSSGSGSTLDLGLGSDSGLSLGVGFCSGSDSGLGYGLGSGLGSGSGSRSSVSDLGSQTGSSLSNGRMAPAVPGNNGRGKPPPVLGRFVSGSKIPHASAKDPDDDELSAPMLNRVTIRCAQNGPNSLVVPSTKQLLEHNMRNISYEMLENGSELEAAYLLQQLSDLRHRKSLAIVASNEHYSYCIDYGISSGGIRHSIWLRARDVVPCVTLTPVACSPIFEHHILTGATEHYKYKGSLKSLYTARNLYVDEPGHYDTFFDDHVTTLMLTRGPAIAAAISLRFFRTMGRIIVIHVELIASDDIVHSRALSQTGNRTKTEYYTAALISLLVEVMQAIGVASKAAEVICLSQSIGFDYSISDSVIKQKMATDAQSVSASTFWGTQFCPVGTDHTLVFLAAQLAVLDPSCICSQCAFHGYRHRVL